MSNVYSLISLYRNRIALLQKEEERARKKIEQTKERAMEILVMRTENEKRVQDYVEATGKNTEHKRQLHTKAKETDYEMRRTRAEQLESIHYRRREEVTEMQHERKQLSKVMLQDQEKDLRMKQKMREEIRKKEEEARYRREQEKRENDRRIKEAYERKAAAEEADARKAEKLVKALEKREREWMIKLRDTQTVQETAFEQLETALLGDNSMTYPVNAYGSGGINGDRSEEDPHNGGSTYSSSSANRNEERREADIRERERERDGERARSANHYSSPSSAGINIVKKVSSRAPGDLPRVGVPRRDPKASTLPRGRAAGMSGGGSYNSSGARAPSIDRTKKRTPSNQRGALRADFVN